MVEFKFIARLQSRSVKVRFLGTLLLWCAMAGLARAQDEAQPAQYTFNDFYVNLEPYGQWIEDPGYGYLFSPNVDGGFRPYFTNGHWCMTQYGNTWVSDYTWGWACFHYGSWLFDPYYGWLWKPGKNWGPAWVMWRFGNGYYGWAPIPPTFDLKPNDPTKIFSCPADWWVFLPCQYLYSSNYYNYWSGPTGTSGIYKGTAAVTNYYENDGVNYVFGPYAKQVEKMTKKPVVQYHLSTSANFPVKAKHEEISFFKPSVIDAPEPGGSFLTDAIPTGSKPVAAKLQSINTSQGHTTPPFKAEAPRKPTPTPFPVVNGKPAATKGKVAPEQPDGVQYEWQNPDHEKQPDSIDHRVAPKMHPDHGPVQIPDPIPRPKDTKKLPAQGVQGGDPVKPEDQRIKK